MQFAGQGRPALPPVWAVVVGIGPVLLAVVLSHLVALVLDEIPAVAGPAAPSATLTSSEQTITAAATVRRPAAEPASVAAPVVESSRAGQVPAQALTGPGVHGAHHGLGLAIVPAVSHRAAGPAAAAAGRGSGGVNPRVARLAAQLDAGADLTGAEVAEQLGCSERTGRRLLRQAQDHTAQDRTAQDRPATAPPGSERERGTG